MSYNYPPSPPFDSPRSKHELWTMAEVAQLMCRTRSGVDKLRARDPSFPKPLKDGDDRRSRIFFVRQEIEDYMAARLQER